MASATRAVHQFPTRFDRGQETVQLPVELAIHDSAGHPCPLDDVGDRGRLIALSATAEMTALSSRAR